VNHKTLDKLEFNKITRELAGFAYFEGGQNLCLNLKPNPDLQLVQQRLDETSEAMEMLRFADPAYLSGLAVITPYLHKVKAGGILTPPELRDIYRVLSASRLAKQDIDTDKYPRMQVMVTELFTDIELEKHIDRIIDEEGEIRDDATAELKKIRGQIQTLRFRIRDYLQDFIRSGHNQRVLKTRSFSETFCSTCQTTVSPEPA
jgi:DNA mismatch repair protein MutS2